MEETRIIISGGGTGGHIFPAVSIANAIKKINPNAKILFVGAEGRMEMTRVPAAGYEIKGLPVRGLIRPLWSPKNIGVMLDFFKSKRIVKNIIREFKPQAAVGVGGYASSPTLNAAHSMGIPCLIQEQNSFAGVTNKSLGRKAEKICVAYEGMERFFPKERIVLTGNPVRQGLLHPGMTKEECAEAFGMTSGKPIVLIIGGSLGARPINNSVLSPLKDIAKADVQFIWQTGKFYSADIQKRLAAAGLGTWTDDLYDPKLSDRAMLETIGYAVADVPQAMTAFQRHFYPEALLRIGSCARARLAAVFKNALRI